MSDFPLAFLGMFESLRMGPTFARGRRDERAGHVRSLTVSGSLVVALVRGPDDPAAFRSRIAVRAFGASEWARVETALVAEARFVADLLDGRMPPGIETVFAGEGLTLLPLSLHEVAMDCTCERWPMPCAHLAATCYALARTFESDPFEVFMWRGRSRDELLMRLRRLREASAVGATGSGPPGGTSGGRSRADSGGSGSSGSGMPGSGASGSGASGSGGSGPGMPGSGMPGSGTPGWGTPGSGAPGDPAGRSDSGGAASGAGPRHPAAADPVAFWGRARPPETEAEAVASGTRPDALLDQLDAPRLTHHGQSVVEVLRAAYLAMPDTPVTD